MGPRDDYARSVAAAAAHRPASFHPRAAGTRPAEPGQRPGIEVAVVSQLPEGYSLTNSMLMVREDGAFRVCGFA